MRRNADRDSIRLTSGLPHCNGTPKGCTAPTPRANNPARIRCMLRARFLSSVDVAEKHLVPTVPHHWCLMRPGALAGMVREQKGVARSLTATDEKAWVAMDARCGRRYLADEQDGICTSQTLLPPFVTLTTTSIVPLSSFGVHITSWDVQKWCHAMRTHGRALAPCKRCRRAVRQIRKQCARKPIV